jgi:hypothetical protein
MVRMTIALLVDQARVCFVGSEFLADSLKPRCSITCELLALHYNIIMQFDESAIIFAVSYCWKAIG